MRQLPATRIGLYDPAFEHDACGVAFVARLNGEPTHETVQRALTALENLEHRGAAGADADTGDGAGILAPAPRRVPPRASSASSCRRAGRYGVGDLLPAAGRRAGGPSSSSCSSDTVAAEGQRVVGWRDVPSTTRHVGATARAIAPRRPPALRRRLARARGRPRTRSSASST